LSVPREVISSFFNKSTSELMGMKPELVHGDSKLLSLGDHRQSLLQIQIEQLKRVVEEYNINSSNPITLEEAQTSLKIVGLPGEETDEELKLAMESMNQAARLAFAKSVVHAEWIYDCLEEEKRPIRVLKKEKDGRFQRDDIMEFCALCLAAMHLTEVLNYLQTGFPPVRASGEGLSLDPAEKGRIPPERMERIHNLIFRAVGYEPKYATEEIKRIFFDFQMGSGAPSEHAGDTELNERFAFFVAKMGEAVTNANLGGTSHLSDVDSGGVTRVVSVSYSEKFVDGDGTNAVGAPSESIMQEQEDVRQQEQIAQAKQAADLQQSILHDLLSLDDAEREEALIQAKEAHENFIKRALELEPGPERIEFMTSIDEATQRKLLQYKLWENILVQNGGAPPTLQKHN